MTEASYEWPGTAAAAWAWVPASCSHGTVTFLSFPMGAAWPQLRSHTHCPTDTPWQYWAAAPEQRTCYSITIRWKKAVTHRRQVQLSKLETMGHAQCQHISCIRNYLYQLMWTGLSFLQQLGECTADFTLSLAVPPHLWQGRKELLTQKRARPAKGRVSARQALQLQVLEPLPFYKGLLHHYLSSHRSGKTFILNSSAS